MRLKDKIALVTGASRGIGRAIALAYAREGARLAVTARTERDLQSLKAEAEALGVPCSVIVADLARRESAREVFAAFHAHYDHLDILVNNAGIGSSAGPALLVEFDDELWDRTLFVNLTMPYLLCKLFVPEMLRRRWGRVINISSGVARTGLVFGSAYAASKHGLLGMMRSLAMENIGSGVTFNAISPGVVRTAASAPRIAFDAKRLGRTVEAHIAALTPLGRLMEPDEMAPMAVILASDEAAAMTGQAINVDCGLQMI